MLTPGEFARCVVPLGTTCVLADPNCVGNVLGEPAMRWAGATGTPLKILQQVSHRIPRAPALELGGAVVEEAEQFAMLTEPTAVGVGESVPFGFDERAARFQARLIHEDGDEKRNDDAREYRMLVSEGDQFAHRSIAAFWPR